MAKQQLIPNIPNAVADHDLISGPKAILVRNPKINKKQGILYVCVEGAKLRNEVLVGTQSGLLLNIWPHEEKAEIHKGNSFLLPGCYDAHLHSSQVDGEHGVTVFAFIITYKKPKKFLWMKF